MLLSQGVVRDSELTKTGAPELNTPETGGREAQSKIVTVPDCRSSREGTHGKGITKETLSALVTVQRKLLLAGKGEDDGLVSHTWAPGRSAETDWSVQEEPAMERGWGGGDGKFSLRRRCGFQQVPLAT